MPVVVTANPKGGCGKTTTATLLATTAAHAGASVALIDCDPNAPHRAWRTGSSLTTVAYHQAASEVELLQAVEHLKTQHQLVVVDLEGLANVVMSDAIALGDLILIPMAPTALDMAQTRKTLALVRHREQLLRRTIHHRVVFTSTEAKGATRDEKDITAALVSGGAQILETKLHNRVAFSSVFTRRLTLYELPKEISGLRNAVLNAEAFADEVGGLLSQIAAEKRAVAA